MTALMLNEDDGSVAPDEAQYAADRTQVNQWRQQSMQVNRWRADSMKAHEYWDGNQFDEELAEKYRQRGLPMLAENCIKRWINTVVGQQAINQVDGVVKIEDNRFEHFAEAMSAKLKQAEALSAADKACLLAFDAGIKGGLGWVEVGDPVDPFDYEHRAEVIPWREMFWDMSAKKFGLYDADWFRRVRGYRRSDLLPWFSDKAELLKGIGTGSDDTAWMESERYERDSLMMRDPSRWTMANGSMQDMIALNEIRYRVLVNGYAIKTPRGVELFDLQNPMHVEAYNRGIVDPKPCTYRRVRQAFWAGPHRLLDRWCPVPNNEIGWVPFQCYVEDRTGVPYGLIRDMLSLQDEINTRKAKAAWSMDQTTIIADDDATKNWNQVRQAVNRRDGIILLDGTKQNKRFELDRHPGLTASNMQMYNDAKATIGYVHGLDAPFAGTPSAPGQSGVAIEGLVQQSNAALGMPIDNFRMSRRRVLNLLLDRIVADLGDQPTVIRYQRSADKAHRTLAVNVPVQMEDGTVEIMSPRTIKMQLVLDETPSTATYRQVQYNRILDALRSMPPEAQAILLPAMFEMSELPNRQMYADMARKQLGIGEPKNEAEAKAMAEEQAKKDAEAALVQRAAEAKVALDEARAKQLESQTTEALQTMQATMQQLLAQVGEIYARTGKIKTETAAIEQDMRDQAVTMAQGGPDKTNAVYRW